LGFSPADEIEPIALENNSISVIWRKGRRIALPFSSNYMV
jgi:hypothetical protein